MASRKPIKHERNVHNIKRHRSINRGSRVSKGARCRSIDVWRGRGSSFAKSGSERCCLYVAARESVEREIRQLQFYRILSPSNLQCPLSTLPLPPLFPSRLFSTNFSPPSSSFLVYSSPYRYSSKFLLLLSFSSFSFNEKKGR